MENTGFRQENTSFVSRDAFKLVKDFYGISYDPSKVNGKVDIDPITLRRQNKTWVEIEDALAHAKGFREYANNTCVQMPENGVSVMYQAVFDRLPDKEGMGIYAKKLREGVSAHDVIDELLRSGEYRDRQVSLLYRELLRRNPDEEGRDLYKNQLLEGRALSEIVSEMRSSEEHHEIQAATPPREVVRPLSGRQAVQRREERVRVAAEEIERRNQDRLQRRNRQNVGIIGSLGTFIKNALTRNKS